MKPSPSDLICKTCGKAFTMESYFKKHEKNHSSRKYYLCAKCDKAFSTKAHLKYHEQLHLRKEDYSCSMCGKSFKRLIVLKVHGIVHSGERSHSCEICGKSFKQVSHLKTHEIGSHGEKIRLPDTKIPYEDLSRAVWIELFYLAGRQYQLATDEDSSRAVGLESMLSCSGSVINWNGVWIFWSYGPGSSVINRVGRVDSGTFFCSAV